MFLLAQALIFAVFRSDHDHSGHDHGDFEGERNRVVKEQFDLNWMATLYYSHGEFNSHFVVYLVDKMTGQEI